MGFIMRDGLVLAIGVVSSLAACDSAPPPRDTLKGWPPGDPVEVGGCRFLLSKASLWHSSEWHLEVKLSAEGIGAEAVHCGFSVQAVADTGVALTKAGTGGGKVGPGEVQPYDGHARELDETGMSSGPAEGAWVFVELSAGRWPMAETRGVVVSPERVRPP